MCLMLKVSHTFTDCDIEIPAHPKMTKYVSASLQIYKSDRKDSLSQFEENNLDYPLQSM